jgi:predicted patatin/cPLA2 family phospholipase
LYFINKDKTEVKLKDIENRVDAVKLAIRERSDSHLEELNRLNKYKLEREHQFKMDKLVKKLKDEEENYENMKKELIQLTKEKPLFKKDNDMETNKLERVKLESEKLYLIRK